MAPAAPTGEIRRTILCALLLGAGGRLLLRVTQAAEAATTGMPAANALAGPTDGFGAGGFQPNPAIALLGVALLAAAVALAAEGGPRRALAWMISTTLVLLTVAVALWQGLLGPGMDWVALAISFAAAFVFVLPATREGYLGVQPDP
ncbi:MAG: hypothetical protein ACRC1H_12855 [Caldilineaceae bacterium]